MASSALDHIMHSIHWWGAAQKVQFWLMMSHILVTAFHVLAIVFIGRAAKFKCASILPETLSQYVNWTSSASDVGSSSSIVGQNELNDSLISSFLNQTVVTYLKCSVDVQDASGNSLWSGECPNGYSYTEPKYRTIVTEWHLVCDRDELSDVSQLLFALGMAFGAFGFTTLADRFGRKSVYLVAHSMLVLVALATVFAPNFATFAVLRFFTGAGQQGVGMVAWVLLIEMVPTSRRALVGQVGVLMWPVAVLNLGFMGYLTRDLNWRYMQLLSLSFSIVLIPQWWLCDESLRWLVANDKTAEAEKIIEKTAKRNKVSPSKALDILHNGDSDGADAVPLASLAKSAGDKRDEGKTSDKNGLLDAIKSRHVLVTTAVTMYLKFAESATYYGLMMTSDSMVDDLYLGFTLSVLVEIPAGVVFLVVIDRYNRKTNIVAFHTLAGVALLVSVFLTTVPAMQSMPAVGVMKVISTLIGKFAISAGYGVVWMYLPEVFPTNIRNTCFGLASVAGRIGGMVAPFSRTLGRHLPWAPGLIFAVLCLLISVMTWFLPETRGKELPQTIAEMEAQARTRPNRVDHAEKC